MKSTADKKWIIVNGSDQLPKRFWRITLFTDKEREYAAQMLRDEMRPLGPEHDELLALNDMERPVNRYQPCPRCSGQCVIDNRTCSYCGGTGESYKGEPHHA